MPAFDHRTFAAVTRDRLVRTRSPSSLAFVLWQLVSIPTVHAAMGLERILRPSIAAQPIREPLFIVGHFRSGTTLLLKLLAADPRNACFTTYELGIPSPGLRRRLPESLRRWAAQTLAAHLAPLEAIHPMRLHEPEEDELLFLHLGNSGLYEMLLPLGRTTERRVSHFWTWPRHKRDRFGAFHRACVQRLLRDRGARNYVGKSPHAGGRIEDLRRWYPDARFVYLVRSPLEAIPSALSMAAALWRAAGIDPRRETDAMLRLYRSLVDLYVRTDQQIALLPKDSFRTVLYPELALDPMRTVRTIYGWLGRSLDIAAGGQVELEAARASGWRSQHVYDLGSFGLTADTVRDDLGFLLDKYQFDGQDAGARRADEVEIGRPADGRVIAQAIRKEGGQRNVG